MSQEGTNKPTRIVTLSPTRPVRRRRRPTIEICCRSWFWMYHTSRTHRLPAARAVVEVANVRRGSDHCVVVLVVFRGGCCCCDHLKDRFGRAGHGCRFRPCSASASATCVLLRRHETFASHHTMKACSPSEISKIRFKVSHCPRLGHDKGGIFFTPRTLSRACGIDSSSISM
jgi:hypothetical protein